jgi:hypothetical protein
MDTVGIIALPLAICVYLINLWLVERSHMSLNNIYQFVGFKTSANVQIGVGIIYAMVLLRCIAAGITVTHRYQRQSGEDVLLTGMSGHKIIRGQWYAALYQVRGWMVALGLVRITAALIMMLEYNLIYHSQNLTGEYFIFPISRIVLMFLSVIILSLFEIWATVNVGIFTGTWFKRSTKVWLIAVILRATPVLLFCCFPQSPYYAVSQNFFSIRWHEFTWFTFADGGTTAILRFACPLYLGVSDQTTTSHYIHGLLALLAAIQMLLIYGIGSYILVGLRWRWSGAVFDYATQSPVQAVKNKHSLENVGITGIALITIGEILVLWINRSPVRYALYDIFFYNPVYLYQLQLILQIAISITTVRAIIAGIVSGRDLANRKMFSVGDIINTGISVCHNLRGWFFGLALVFMAAFAMLYLEHFTSLHYSLVYGCSISPYGSNYCPHFYPGWDITQFTLIFFIIISLSLMISFSSVILGIGAGIIAPHVSVALFIAVMLRIIPVIFGFLLPDIPITGFYPNTLITQWSQNPGIIFADTGIGILFSMAEPYWFLGLNGDIQVSYSLLTFTLITYMLAGYSIIGIALSLASTRYQQWRKQKSLLASSYAEPLLSADNLFDESST